MLQLKIYRFIHDVIFNPGSRLKKKTYQLFQDLGRLLLGKLCPDELKSRSEARVCGVG